MERETTTVTTVVVKNLTTTTVSDNEGRFVAEVKTVMNIMPADVVLIQSSLRRAGDLRGRIISNIRRVPDGRTPEQAAIDDHEAVLAVARSRRRKAGVGRVSAV